MESFPSASFSKLDDDRAWSSQEWKAEATTHVQTRQPDETSSTKVRKVRPDHEEICEISGLETICWEKHSWKYLSFQILQRTKVYVFSDSVF